jgi:RNA-binding protein
MLDLTPLQRRFLKAHAHKLTPIVIVGKSGLTTAIKKELHLCLQHRELIKVKIANDDRQQRESVLSEICAELNAAPVQQIGKVLIIYRPAEAPKLRLPEPTQRAKQ